MKSGYAKIRFWKASGRMTKACGIFGTACSTSRPHWHQSCPRSVYQDWWTLGLASSTVCCWPGNCIENLRKEAKFFSETKRWQPIDGCHFFHTLLPLLSKNIDRLFINRKSEPQQQVSIHKLSWRLYDPFCCWWLVCLINLAWKYHGKTHLMTMLILIEHLTASCDFVVFIQRFSPLKRHL